ncbi:MAG: hydrogenase iron-sulfur subunit [Chloroflexota bacterium]
MTEINKEPKIIGFLCNWCSYAGADGAGMARRKYPPNIKIIRVPCSGRVSPELVMRTFMQGADGVMVLGCHIGDCHYSDGNHRTAKRFPVFHRFMDYMGIDRGRLRIQWVSASEGLLFAEVVTEFTESLRNLPPMRGQLKSLQRHTIAEEIQG